MFFGRSKIEIFMSILMPSKRLLGFGLLPNRFLNFVEEIVTHMERLIS